MSRTTPFSTTYDPQANERIREALAAGPPEAAPALDLPAASDPQTLAHWSLLKAAPRSRAYGNSKHNPEAERRYQPDRYRDGWEGEAD